MARWHFPRRNRLMPAPAGATMLIEAGPTSGTRHQAAACLSLGRPLLVRASLLGQGIEWLDVAHLRGQLLVWQEPTEALRAASELLAA